MELPSPTVTDIPPVPGNPYYCRLNRWKQHFPAWGAKDRAVPGHWEGDLLAGSNNSYIATLVERHTRYVMLAKVKNKDTQSVLTALIKQSRKLPNELYKSLTWDRGKEMAGHQRFTLATDVKVYILRPAESLAERFE